TELRVQNAGLAEVVGVRLDSRREAQQNRLPSTPLGRQPVEQLELVEAVDDDPAELMVERHRQLVGRLVVTVEVDQVGRETGVYGKKQLAAGDDVQPEALLLNELQNHRGGVGLGG